MTKKNMLPKKLGQENISPENQVLLYQSRDGNYHVEVIMQGDTVWLSQKQLAELFKVETNTINYHIKTIFKTKELLEDSVIRKIRITAKDGKSYETNFYNLDLIISVGYRVNSTRATQFRIWATRTLKEHLVKGYTINQERLNTTRLAELEKALSFIKQSASKRNLTNDEGQGLLEIITKYAKSWALLKRYDENNLPQTAGQNPKFILTYEHANKVIRELKQNLLAKDEATKLFGHERETGLQAILGNLEQCFGGQELYPSLESKAANLLYFVIKDHPFLDGNKRVGSFLFIHFLDQNGRLRNKAGEIVINDNALVALALLIAESEPKNKELMVQLVINLME
jgi:prophage maintenance system killer protein